MVANLKAKKMFYKKMLMNFIRSQIKSTISFSGDKAFQFHSYVEKTKHVRNSKF